MSYVIIIRPFRRYLSRHTWCQFRHYASSPSRQVLISTSKNIYENLALETWLFEHANLEKESILLMWNNRPAIVCGRHQNPWLECNLPEAWEAGVDIARRNSGGGTVYHDEGNLNCSFLMHTSLYNRPRNLQLVVDSLKSQWPQLDLSINDREDIVIDQQYKISGTASKLSGKRTYHHFTLLCDVNKPRLEKLLTSQVTGVISKATESVRGRVGSIRQHLPNMDCSYLMQLISQSFLNTKDPCIQYVDPLNSSNYLGINDIYSDLTTWHWIYGKTPEFSMNQQFSQTINNEETDLTISYVIKYGKIQNMTIQFSDNIDIDSDFYSVTKEEFEGVRLERGDVFSAISKYRITLMYQQLYVKDTKDLLDWVLFNLFNTLIEVVGNCHKEDTPIKEMIKNPL